MKELISVVTPFYNQAELCDGVASVAAQDYPRIELIIIDDGSDEAMSDRLREQAERITRGRIESLRWIRHEENLGTVRTLNEGWSEARGKYIFTLAGDDVFWNERVLSLWVQEFEQTDAEILVGYRAVCPESLSQVGYLSPLPSEARLVSSGDSGRIWRRLCRGNFLFGCSTARTAESFRKYGFVPEDYRLIEDWPTMLNLYRRGAKIALYDRIVIKYRTGGTSCPSRVNEIYHRDTVNIFEREIIPFAHSEGSARRMLRRQMRARERQRDYLVMRASKSGLIWNIYCRLLYPECFVNLAKSLFERLFRKKAESYIYSRSGDAADYESIVR
ncbi:MAG: glycosyltransferase [Clostridia bacterium]|nr:glycosyltransferase [Clostridia bacterium]